MFKLLDEAITNIKPDKGLNWGEGKGSNDRCYGGDINKWLRFANTLRLRLALRISDPPPPSPPLSIGATFGTVLMLSALLCIKP